MPYQAFNAHKSITASTTSVLSLMDSLLIRARMDDNLEVVAEVWDLLSTSSSLSFADLSEDSTSMIQVVVGILFLLKGDRP